MLSVYTKTAIVKTMTCSVSVKNELTYCKYSNYIQNGRYKYM